MFAFASCDKKSSDPGNFFSYAGKSYAVDSVALVEWVSNSGMSNEFSVFQFVFTNISGPDTTNLLVAVYDTLTNVLSGNYAGLDEVAAMDASRGIIPFGFIFASGIGMSNGNGFLTGHGGSIDVSVTNGDYNIKLNDISAGVYADMLDTNGDGNSGYTETGKIGGVYKGKITKYTQALSKKSATTNPLIDKLIKSSSIKIKN